MRRFNAITGRFEQYEPAADAAPDAPPVPRKFSQLAIIRELGPAWPAFKSELEAAGVADQFFAADCLDESDAVFGAWLAKLPPEMAALLDKCVREE